MINNVLTVLNVMLKTAVEWKVIDARPPITWMRTTRREARFHDETAFERLAEAAQNTNRTGEAGLRCGEMMGLEWRDVNVANGSLCVARSEWKGHITVPKGGRVRHVPLTSRLGEALERARKSATSSRVL